jgi:cyanophycinase-like exopeptidase
MLLKLTIISFFLISLISYGQDYDYFYVGDTSDIDTSPTYGVCLMGGSTEDDNGSSWFLENADGGNIVVIRASGSDGYNSYFFTSLGINVQSVETIVFNNVNASQSPFVQRRLENAEAIWIAGGDQFVYESYWKNSSIQTILNNHINVKSYPIGGTSAGMAILGDYYFNAENVTTTSAVALNNPFDPSVSIASDFLNVPVLENTITDTHYDNPDRKGRHSVFIAHLVNDNSTMSYGIAAEEFVSICIDEQGTAKVFGQHPGYEDYAYFIRSNCDVAGPSQFAAGDPISWSPAENALEVCVMPATSDGLNTFDLTTWSNIQGGSWEGWNFDSGNLTVSPSLFQSCDNLSVLNAQIKSQVLVAPNPSNKEITVHSTSKIINLSLRDALGRIVLSKTGSNELAVTNLKSGFYHLTIQLSNGQITSHKVLVKH